MNTTFQKKYGISAAVLKYIAVATMLVDHLHWQFTDRHKVITLLFIMQ